MPSPSACGPRLGVRVEQRLRARLELGTLVRGRVSELDLDRDQLALRIALLLEPVGVDQASCVVIGVLDYRAKQGRTGHRG